jgi:hypothetical protein
MVLSPSALTGRLPDGGEKSTVEWTAESIEKPVSVCRNSNFKSTGIPTPNLQQV